MIWRDRFNAVHFNFWLVRGCITEPGGLSNVTLGRYPLWWGHYWRRAGG